MKAGTQNAWLVFHRWTGIIAGLVTVIVGITGSLLVFEDELDVTLNDKLFTISSASHPLPLDQLVAAAEEANPAWKASIVSRVDDATERAFVVTLRDANGEEKQIFINPYTASVNGTRSSLSSMALIRRLHGDLTLGSIGENALGILALLLMAMFVAGLVVWWPRKGTLKSALSVKWDGSSRRVLKDLHNTSGVYLFVFLFLSALTVPPIVWKMTTPAGGPPPAAAQSPNSGLVAGNAPPAATLRAGLAPTIPWQQAANSALSAVPGTWLGFILRPLGPQPFYLIRVFPPGENAVDKQTTVFVNRFNGSIIRISVPAAPTWTSLLSADFAASLHSGAIAGLPGRLFMFVAGLFFPALFVTGFVLWWRR